MDFLSKPLLSFILPSLFLNTQPALLLEVDAETTNQPIVEEIDSDLFQKSIENLGETFLETIETCNQIVLEERGE